MTQSAVDALAALQRQFTARLPERIDKIRTLFQSLQINWQEPERETLHRMVHDLTGSAGTFGHHQISTTARQLEIPLCALKDKPSPSHDHWAELSMLLDALVKDALDPHVTQLNPSLAPSKRPTKLLWIEDQPQQHQDLRSALQAAGYQLVQTLEHDAHPPDAIVMSIAAGSEPANLTMPQGLNPSKPPPPLIVLGAAEDLESRLRFLRAGACRYLSHDEAPDQLLELLNALTHQQPDPAYRVLLVDDNAVSLKVQGHFLHSVGLDLRTLAQPLQVFEVLREFDAEVIILDVYMPEASGPEIAALLRQDKHKAHIPIVFLSAETDLQPQLTPLRLFGDDRLVKPVQGEHLVAVVCAHARRTRMATNPNWSV